MHLFLLQGQLKDEPTPSRQMLKRMVQAKPLQTQSVIGVAENPKPESKFPTVFNNTFMLSPNHNKERFSQTRMSQEYQNETDNSGFNLGYKINKSLQCLFKRKNINLQKLSTSIKTTNQTALNIQKSHQKKNLTQYILEQIIADINRVKENRLLDADQQEQEIIRIIKTCKTATKETRDYVNQALKVRADRDQCTLILQQMLSACVIFRNHAFQLILHYNCARINFYYKNVHKCILLMKATKQYSYMSENFEYARMKCYQILGECFMNLRPTNCKTYLTKFLQMSWKLNSSEHELKAYEMMGKYYFYVGDSNKAQFYHQRIVDGNLESENSPMRKLALSKIQNSLSQRHKKETQKLLALGTQEAEYMISSEEESFDFLMASSDKDESNYFQLKKKSLQKYSLRTSKIFDTSKDSRTVNLIYKAANTNIRQPKDERSKPKYMMNIQLRSNASLGKLKDRVFVTHLSPNRELSNYQTIELLTNANQSKALNSLQLYNENFEMMKIKHMFNKLLQMVNQIDEWLINIC